MLSRPAPVGPGGFVMPRWRVAPLARWAPEGPAAREIATREPAARSGRSRSPPVPSGPSGALRTSGAVLRRGRQPARESSALRASLGASSRSPPVPSGPSGALHTSGAWCAGVWLDVLSWYPARPRRPPAPRPGPSIPRDSHPAVTSHIHEPAPNFACNSPETISNLEFWSLELQRFRALLRFRPVELHASFLGSGRVDACWWRSRCVHTRCAVA